MLDYVYGSDQVVANSVAQLIPHARRGFGKNCSAIGIIEVDDKGVGRLIAGMVYHNWDPEAAIIEMSGAALPGKYWLTRETLARIYRYPFLQLGCQQVVMRVPTDNQRLLGILAAFGYKLIPFERLFGRERDGMICRLTYEMWVDNKFNRRLKHHMREPLGEAA